MRERSEQALSTPSRVPPSRYLALLLCGACAGDPCADVGTICHLVGVPRVSGAGADDVPADASALSLPVDATWAPDGTLLVVDWNNHRLRRVDLDGRIRTIAGTGREADGPEGPALAYAFDHPTAVAVDPDEPDLLLVAAWQNSRVVAVDLAAERAHVVCGTGARSYAGDGGPCAEAVLDLPSSVVFDGAGGFFVGDQANSIVRQVDADGVIRTVAGQPPAPDPEPDPSCPAPCLVRQPGWSGDGGLAIDATFHGSAAQSAYPGSRLARAGARLVVADTQNHVVREIDLETGLVAHLAGTGTEPGHTGDGGPASTARLNLPSDVAVGPDGSVYVADTDNHCVRRVAPDGTIDAVAGRCGEQGHDGDGGPATEARLFAPFGVEVSPDGTILVVADTVNHALRAVRLR